MSPHHQLCPRGPDDYCECSLIDKVTAFVLTQVLSVLEDREHDLRTCNKDDDCHVKAQGVSLAIDDVRHSCVTGGIV